MSERWATYYRHAADDPRETLLAALDAFDREGAEPGLAVDLGCGLGRDTVALLARGWRVLAVDGEEQAIDRLRARPEAAAAGSRLDTAVARFEDAAWPPARLVNASFALPFCPPAAWPALWERIEASLEPGGRFSGQLFGVRDEWAGDRDMTFLERAEVDRLLAGWDVELLREVEEDGTIVTGAAKHWHLFHVVARRP